MEKQTQRREIVALGKMGRSGNAKRNGRAWHHQSNGSCLGTVWKTLCLPSQLEIELGSNGQRDDRPKPAMLSKGRMERNERGKQVAMP